jgi:hypothetical protein
VPNYADDDAIVASINGPRDFVNLTAGKVLIADTGNGRVILYQDGKVRIVAGTGEAGYTGDGGPATLATLKEPSGVSIDENGGIYISDHANNVIRYVSPSGMIDTVVGQEESGYTGDGGPATEAKLSGPVGIDLVGDQLRIADTGNNVIRLVNLETNVISTAEILPSNHPITLSSPTDVTSGFNGSFYIADSENRRVLKADSTGAARVIVTRSKLFRIYRDSSGRLAISTANGISVIGSTGFRLSPQIFEPIRACTD